MSAYNIHEWKCSQQLFEMLPGLLAESPLLTREDASLKLQIK